MEGLQSAALADISNRKQRKSPVQAGLRSRPSASGGQLPAPTRLCCERRSAAGVPNGSLKIFDGRDEDVEATRHWSVGQHDPPDHPKAREQHQKVERVADGRAMPRYSSVPNPRQIEKAVEAQRGRKTPADGTLSHLGGCGWRYGPVADRKIVRPSTRRTRKITTKI
jgi:hypothetical protein